MSAPNKFGSNLIKSIVATLIDPLTGQPYSEDHPFPIDLVLSDTDGLATAANQTTQIAAAASQLAKTPALGTAGTPSADVITAQGVGYTGTSTITRAANQTPYSAGDVVGGPLTIATAGPSGGDVLITSVRLLWNISALPSGMGNYTLYFYNATPPSAIADNSPFTLGSGDRSAFLGLIDNLVVSAVGVGTQSVFGRLAGFLAQYKLVAGTSLYAYLVTNAGYTPAANSETGTLTTKGILP